MLTRFWPTRPRGPSWFIVEKGAKGFSHDKPEDKHGIRLSNTAALALNDVYVDADRLVGGVEGQGLIQAQAVFGYTRLMVAAFGLGAGWAALDRAIPYSTKRIQAGRAALRKAGIHAQADRAERGAAGSRPRLHRRDRGAHRRRCEGSLNTEGAIAKYMATEAGQCSRRGQHPGAGRLRLHARIHGGEDQARRAHHHDLRRHFRDHGDDHQPRPLAASFEDARRSIITSRRGQFEALHASQPNVGAGIAALAFHALGRSDGAELAWRV